MLLIFVLVLLAAVWGVALRLAWDGLTARRDEVRLDREVQRRAAF